MTFPESEFVQKVRNYVALIDGASELRAYDILVRAAILLPEIYATGMTIPEVEPVTDEIVAFSNAVVMEILQGKMGKYDSYFEVFDPTEDEKPVVASLSDDLADIFLDLMGPLVAYDRGQRLDALWEWRFNIRSHCGDHLVDALRTIHRLVNYHMSPDYEA